MLKAIRNMACATALVCTPGAASAALIVDTGTPTGDVEYSLFRNGNDSGQNLAAKFDIGPGGTVITDLEGFVSGIGTYSISVASSGGEVPLATLFLGQATSTTSGGGWSGLHGLNLNLSSGSYWVIYSVRPDLMDNLSGGGMRGGAPSPVADEAFFSIPDFLWYPADTLDIGVRITDNSVLTGPGVPEPATWAMMIIGFGAAGSMIRRRNALAA